MCVRGCPPYLTLFPRPEAQGGVLRDALYLVAVVFLVVELISLYIGVTMTRTITTAFDDLYESTESVRQGDFSHRIQVRGGDQIATVSQSFNRMTENLQRLLVVAIEKERMQAELEIAREVQSQLFPRAVPNLERLELTGAVRSGTPGVGRLLRLPTADRTPPPLWQSAMWREREYPLRC